MHADITYTSHQNHTPDASFVSSVHSILLHINWRIDFVRGTNLWCCLLLRPVMPNWASKSLLLEGNSAVVYWTPIYHILGGAWTKRWWPDNGDQSEYARCSLEVPFSEPSQSRTRIFTWQVIISRALSTKASFGRPFPKCNRTQFDVLISRCKRLCVRVSVWTRVRIIITPVLVLIKWKLTFQMKFVHFVELIKLHAFDIPSTYSDLSNLT